MPENEPQQHPAAEKAMRWLGGNWWVPIVTALTLEAIARAPERHCPKTPPAPTMEGPSVAGPHHDMPEPEM